MSAGEKQEVLLLAVSYMGFGGVWGFFSCKKLEEERWSSGTSSHLLRGFTGAAPVAERRRQEGFRRGLRHKAAATAGLKVEQEPDRG